MSDNKDNLRYYGDNLNIFRRNKSTQLSGEKGKIAAEVTSKALRKMESRKYLMVLYTHRGTPRTDPPKKVDTGGE